MKGIAAFRPVNHLKVIIFNPFLTDIIFKHFFRSMLGELVPAVSLMGYRRLYGPTRALQGFRFARASAVLRACARVEGNPPLLVSV